MSTRTVPAIECTCDACGYVWVVIKLPQRCASCKRWNWNRGGPRQYRKQANA